MTFKVMIDDFSHINEALDRLDVQLNADVSVAKAQNKRSLDGDNGEWVNSASEQFMTLQVGLLASTDGVHSLQQTCSNALNNLESLKTTRDRLLAAFDASASRPNTLFCEPASDVESAVENANDEMNAFSRLVDDAVNGANGLDGGGPERKAIVDELQKLSDSIKNQIKKVETIGDDWSDFKNSIYVFDNTYSAAFSQPLIKSSDISNAKEDINATIMNSISSVKSEKDLAKWIKNMGTFLSSGSDIAKQLLSDPKDKELMREVFDGVKDLLNVKDVDWKKVDFKSLGKDLWNTLKKKENVLALGQEGASPNYWDRFKEKLDIREYLSDKTGVSLNGKESGWGKVGDAFKEDGKLGAVKGIGKGLAQGANVLSLGLDVVGTAYDAYNSYSFTQGGTAKKAATAVTTVVSDITDIGVSYAASAAVGAAVGGPVGAVVGIAAGAATSFVWNKFKGTSLYKNAQKGVEHGVEDAFHGFGNAVHGIFGGGH